MYTPRCRSISDLEGFAPRTVRRGSTRVNNELMRKMLETLKMLELLEMLEILEMLEMHKMLKMS